MQGSTPPNTYIDPQRLHSFSGVTVYKERNMLTPTLAFTFTLHTYQGRATQQQMHFHRTVFQHFCKLFRILKGNQPTAIPQALMDLTVREQPHWTLIHWNQLFCNFAGGYMSTRNKENRAANSHTLCMLSRILCTP